MELESERGKSNSVRAAVGGRWRNHKGLELEFSRSSLIEQCSESGLAQGAAAVAFARPHEFRIVKDQAAQHRLAAKVSRILLTSASILRRKRRSP